MHLLFSYLCNKFILWLNLGLFRLSGCYESLEGGNTGDAVVDFSGAVAEAINLEVGAFHSDQKKQDQLFEDLLKVYDRGGIISCSIKVCSVHVCVCLPKRTWPFWTTCLFYTISSGTSPWNWEQDGKRAGERPRILGDRSEKSASGSRAAGLLQERDHPSDPHEEPLGQNWVERGMEWQVGGCYGSLVLFGL